MSQDVVVQTSQDGLAATLSLRARGVCQRRLESDTIHFGILEPGDTHSDFVVIANRSSTRLTVTAVDGLMAPFSIPDGQVPATGEPMDSVRFLVSFSPEEEGDFEQTVTVRTNGGDFIVNLVGRALAPGALTLLTVLPSWAPIDEAVQLQVRGGPFPEGAVTMTVGETVLEDVERLDDRTVVGTLPANAEAPLGPQDVRVDFGGSFGLLTGRLIRTPPVSAGQVLSAETDWAEPLSAAGNPWRLQGPLSLAERVTILPGVVVVAEAADGEDGGVIDFQAGAEIGSREGVVVFSSTQRNNWNWQGLRFSAGDEPSTLLNTVVEYAGINRTPCISVSVPCLSIEGSRSRGPKATPALSTLQDRYQCGGGLFREDLREAMRLQGDSIGQLSQDHRAQWDTRSGQCLALRRRPIGAGHQWAEPFLHSVEKRALFV